MKKNIASIVVLVALITLLGNSEFYPNRPVNSESVDQASYTEIVTSIWEQVSPFVTSLGEILMMLLPHFLMITLIFFLILQSLSLLLRFIGFAISKRHENKRGYS